MRKGTRVLVSLAFLMGCLGVFVLMLRSERQTVVDMADRLADLDRRATAKLAELQQQVDDGQAKSGSLDRALVEAREQLARNDDRHRSDEATATDAVANLQAERQQGAALADKSAESERRAAAQLTDLQQRLEAERARTSGLDHDLGDARQQLARLEDRQRTAEMEARDAEGLSQARTQQAAGLADRLADTERRSSADTKALQEQLESAQKKAARLELDLAEARLQLLPAPKVGEDPRLGDSLASNPGAKPLDGKPEAILPPSAPSADASLLPPKPDASPLPGQAQAIPAVPPRDVPARIVLRYALGSDSAKARAQSAETLLQAQGMHIEDRAAPAKGVSASKVTFYYREDQAAAKKISDALAVFTGSDTIQKPPMSLKPMPRPGTIEVVISG